VLDCQEAFLYMLRVATLDDHRLIDKGAKAATLPEQADRHQFSLPTCSHSSDHVLGVSASTNAYQHVARIGKGVNLSLEDSIVSVVISIGGKKRGVGGQSDGWEAGPITVSAQSVKKFGRHMLCIGGASTISAD